MRKMISGLSALLTAAMLIAPMSAFVDTTINPDADNMPNPKPGTAGTTVEFSVDPAYTYTQLYKQWYNTVSGSFTSIKIGDTTITASQMTAN